MRARLSDRFLIVAALSAVALGLLVSVVVHRVTTHGSLLASANGRMATLAKFEPPQPMVEAAPVQASAASVTDAESIAGVSPFKNGAAAEKTVGSLPGSVRLSRGPSQLVRTGSISLDVTDVSRALAAASRITDLALGDVLALSDQTPSSPSDAHNATMQIRVPEDQFDRTLDELGKLGKVQSKSVSAQDISDQLIDASARLRNLRREEADILSIMDRSGNIEQVLNVTQQLSDVRDQIERLDAQLASMKYQVAYSTIDISFTSPAIVSGPTAGKLIADAWETALAQVGGFTVSLLSVVLWVLAFSPYFVALGIVALLVRRMRARRLTAPS